MDTDQHSTMLGYGLQISRTRSCSLDGTKATFVREVKKNQQGNTTRLLSHALTGASGSLEVHSGPVWPRAGSRTQNAMQSAASESWTSPDLPSLSNSRRPDGPSAVTRLAIAGEVFSLPSRVRPDELKQNVEAPVCKMPNTEQQTAQESSDGARCVPRSNAGAAVGPDQGLWIQAQAVGGPQS